MRFYSACNARIASAVLAMAIPSVRPSVCLSVRPSVRLSHAGIVSKRRHVARCSLHRWIAKCVTWYGSRHWRRPHCIIQVPSASRKGHSTPPPLFVPYLLWPNGRPSQLLLSSCFKHGYYIVVTMVLKSDSETALESVDF